MRRRARTDLREGRPVKVVPTATAIQKTAEPSPLHEDLSLLRSDTRLAHPMRSFFREEPTRAWKAFEHLAAQFCQRVA